MGLRFLRQPRLRSEVRDSWVAYFKITCNVLGLPRARGRIMDLCKDPVILPVYDDLSVAKPSPCKVRLWLMPNRTES